MKDSHNNILLYTFKDVYLIFLRKIKQTDTKQILETETVDKTEYNNMAQRQNRRKQNKEMYVQRKK